jgi:predicted Zn finger-like uncharacterized protein
VTGSQLTRCPGCATVFRITPEQLAFREGQVRCGHCRAIFDANDHFVSLESIPPADVFEPPAAPQVEERDVTNEVEPAHGAVFDDVASEGSAIAGAGEGPAVEDATREGAAAQGTSDEGTSDEGTSDEETSRGALPRERAFADVDGKPGPASEAAGEEALTSSSGDIGSTQGGFEYTESSRPAIDATESTPSESAAVDADTTEAAAIGARAAEDDAVQAGATVGETQADDAIAESAEADTTEADATELDTTEAATTDTEAPEEKTGDADGTAADVPAPIGAALGGPAERFEWKKKRNVPAVPQRVYAIAAVALGVGLLLQIVLEYRDLLAAYVPAARPLLSAACEPLGCTVGPLRDGAALSIDASDLQADPAHRGLLLLSATIRNRAGHAIAFPYLELMLTDASDHVVVRRAFPPAEYASGSADIAGGIPPNGEHVVRVFLDASSTQQAGYRVYLFYP